MILLKNVRPYDKSADVQDILICGRDIIEIAPNIDVPERLTADDRRRGPCCRAGLY